MGLVSLKLQEYSAPEGKGTERRWSLELAPRLRAALQGAGEAFAVGFGAVVLAAWSDPAHVNLSWPALRDLALTGTKYGVVYAVGWARMNSRFRSASALTRSTDMEVKK